MLVERFFCFKSKPVELEMTCHKRCRPVVRLWDFVIWHLMGIKENLRYGRTAREQRRLECTCQSKEILRPTFEDCKSQNGSAGKNRSHSPKSTFHNPYSPSVSIPGADEWPWQLLKQRVPCFSARQITLPKAGCRAQDV